MTLPGEERSLVPEKLYHFLGVQREGRIEKAGRGSCFGVIRLARLSPVSCLPVLKEPGFELSCAASSLARNAAFTVRVL